MNKKNVMDYISSHWDEFKDDLIIVDNVDRLLNDIDRKWTALNLLKKSQMSSV